MGCAGEGDWQAWTSGQPSPAQAHGQLGGFDAAATSAMATPTAEPSPQPEPEPAMPEGAQLSSYTLIFSPSDADHAGQHSQGLPLPLKTESSRSCVHVSDVLHCLSLHCAREWRVLDAQSRASACGAMTQGVPSHRAEPPRDMTDADEDLIGGGKALELLEVWQGVFQGSRLVKAGKYTMGRKSLPCWTQEYRSIQHLKHPLGPA